VASSVPNYTQLRLVIVPWSNMRPIRDSRKNPNPVVTRAGVHAPVNLSIPARYAGTGRFQPEFAPFYGRL
jgi:hypothetical protein